MTSLFAGRKAAGGTAGSRMTKRAPACRAPGRPAGRRRNRAGCRARWSGSRPSPSPGCFGGEERFEQMFQRLSENRAAVARRPAPPARIRCSAENQAPLQRVGHRTMALPIRLTPAPAAGGSGRTRRSANLAQFSLDRNMPAFQARIEQETARHRPPAPPSTGADIAGDLRAKGFQRVMMPPACSASEPTMPRFFRRWRNRHAA